MNIFLEEIPEEIKPVERSEDNGLVITPEIGKRGEGVSDLQKEIIGLDALIIGPSAAAELHGVPQSSASKYANGLDVKEETRLTILGERHKIEDKAVTRLLNTLDLLNPAELEKPRDKIALLGALGNVLDRFTSKEKEGTQVLHLHLHAPSQNKETDYETIEA